MKEISSIFTALEDLIRRRGGSEKEMLYLLLPIFPFHPLLLVFKFFAADEEFLPPLVLPRSRTCFVFFTCIYLRFLYLVGEGGVISHRNVKSGVSLSLFPWMCGVFLGNNRVWRSINALVSGGYFR